MLTIEDMGQGAKAAMSSMEAASPGLLTLDPPVGLFLSTPFNYHVPLLS